eukprot:gnl/Chilomastix_caulleri/4387.p1 GENE.gnl/Chilomastix_caulleri/4387~~gnl/Chilomastix_caulleri/4387.p1  ORF type:complete len:67 (+),score=10.53 gnl/Chilomastix_caulleri/4387:32-232(+)
MRRRYMARSVASDDTETSQSILEAIWSAGGIKQQTLDKGHWKLHQKHHDTRNINLLLMIPLRSSNP